MAADLVLLLAAGCDPQDRKRSILRYGEDIEPTLDALATITGQLPRILDQLSVFLADRQRRAEFTVDPADESPSGPVEPEAATAADLLTGAVPAARQLAAAVEEAKRTVTPDPRRRRRRELLGVRRRRDYRQGRRA